MTAQRAGPAPLDEEAGELEVAALPGRPGQLRQRHLDLRMAADADPPVRAELVVDVVRQAARHLRQQVVVPGPQPGDRRLEQVAEAVQLVPGLQVGVARGLPGPPEAGVQVAVGFLGRGDPLGQRPVAVVEVAVRSRPSSQAMASSSL